MLYFFLALLFVLQLAVISYIDYRHYIIKNSHLAFLLLSGFFLAEQHFICWQEELLVKLSFIALTFFPVYFLSDGLGGGDVKLACCLALPLSYAELLTAIFIALFSALICFLFLKKKQILLPFAPFLSAGTLIALLLRLQP